MPSVMNSYPVPFHVKTIGHELPRRSICSMACGFAAGELHFVLHDAARPEQPHDVRLGRGAETGQHLRRALPEEP